MSATPVLAAGAGPRSAARTAVEPVTLRRVVASEWLKFRTLRSTLAVLAAAVVGMVGIGLIVAYNTRTITPQIDPNDRVQSATLQGYYLGQLLIGALGVLFVSGEYSTGMTRSTFSAVPRRLPVLWAKLIVFAAVTAVAMIAASVVAFVSAQALISGSRPGYSLTDPGVLRVVIGTGLYLTMLGVIGGALAWIVRSTPGSLVAYLGLVLVIPVLFGTVLGNWGKHVAEVLPSSAGGAFVQTLPEQPALSPWTGLAVLVAWTVAAVALAALQLRRRDT